MRADERSVRTGEVNSHNAVLVSECGRKPSSSSTSSSSFSLLDALKVPQRDVILAWLVGSRIISHHVLHTSRRRPFPSNWPVSFFHLRLPVHRWDHGCVHYGHMLWRADCEIGGGGVCVRVGGGVGGGRVKGSAVAANDN